MEIIKFILGFVSIAGPIALMYGMGKIILKHMFKKDTNFREDGKEVLLAGFFAMLIIVLVCCVLAVMYTAGCAIYMGITDNII